MNAASGVLYYTPPASKRRKKPVKPRVVGRWDLVGNQVTFTLMLSPGSPMIIQTLPGSVYPPLLGQ